MKHILSAIMILCALSLTDCGNGKKKAGLWWMALLGAGGGATQSSDTTSSGGEATTNSNDQTGDTGFSFQTTTTIPISVTVNDSEGPVQGAVVSVSDPSTNPPSTVFQAVTGADGSVNGNFTVSETTTTVDVTVDAGGNSVTQPISTNNLIAIDRDVTYSGDVTIPTSGDSDGDGIPNETDYYPDDATRATRVQVPASGSSIIAYEDLYPSPGDADFNDYVVKVANEYDLNAAGKVVRVRGTYTHIAKGAGYNHTLKLTLPGSGGLTWNVKTYSAGGTLESNTSNHYGNGTGLAVLGNSGTTISQSNTASNQTFTPGKKAEVEAILDAPVTANALGGAPYDLYINVINTNKDIHFPRKYYDNAGADLYMDSHGFPWALQIPNSWNWPLESDNVDNGYSGFRPWYLSGGDTNKDWYLTPNSSHVFSAGGVGSYILKGYGGLAVLIATAVIGLAGLVIVISARRKSVA